MVEKLFKRNAKKLEKKLEEDTGWLVIEKDGTIRKAKPEEVPENVIDTKGGASSENGIPCDISKNLDWRLRKRERRT